MRTTLANPSINGIDTDALTQAIEAISDDPSKARTNWQVTSHWRGRSRPPRQSVAGAGRGLCVSRGRTSVSRLFSLS
jgi:hypothetical protein